MSPTIASPPTALCLRLGEHRLAIGGGERLGWPVWRSYASAVTSVHVGVAGGPTCGKEEKGDGRICKKTNCRNSVTGRRVIHR